VEDHVVAGEEEIAQRIAGKQYAVTPVEMDGVITPLTRKRNSPKERISGGAKWQDNQKKGLM